VVQIAPAGGDVLTVDSHGRVTYSTIYPAAPDSGQLRFTNSVVPDLSNIIAVASSRAGTLALQSDGTIHFVGSSESCACAAVAIASGESGEFALTADGTVIQFGLSYARTPAPWALTREIRTLPLGGGDLVPAPSGTVISLDGDDPADFIAWSNTVAISTGYGFNLGLQRNGTVMASGLNTDGQCNVPAGLSNVVAIAAGGYHSVALKSDGSVVGWGYNEYGQAPSGNVGAMAISAGALHTLALLSNHTVTAWGDYNHNQNSTPNGLTNVIAVAAGGAHNLALTTAGAVYAWGYDNHGQIDVPTGLSNVVAIAAGGDHSLALKSDGTIVAWGSNTYGESTVPSYLGPAIAISAGFNDSMALVLPATPSLQQQLTGSDVILSWPSVYSGFILQRSDGPASGNWADCTTEVASVGNQFVVTNTLSKADPLFFRLKRVNPN
jgi:alpha-tubulin suppressor-like RCC1 family protein